MYSHRPLTTGQVARICHASPRTVTKWFDRGRLQGYCLPESRDRRIPRRSLVKFLDEHGMLRPPTFDRLVLISSRVDVIRTLQAAFPVEEGYQLIVVDPTSAIAAFELGMGIGSHPRLVVIDHGSFTDKQWEVEKKMLAPLPKAWTVAINVPLLHKLRNVVPTAWDDVYEEALVERAQRRRAGAKHPC